MAQEAVVNLHNVLDAITNPDEPSSAHTMGRHGTTHTNYQYSTCLKSKKSFRTGSHALSCTRIHKESYGSIFRAGLSMSLFGPDSHGNHLCRNRNTRNCFASRNLPDRKPILRYFSRVRHGLRRTVIGCIAISILEFN